MAQVARTTSGMISPGTTEIQNRINALRARFTSGEFISAADINELYSIFITFNDHYHQTSDLAYSAFGNTYATGTFYDTNPENTGRMIDARGYRGSVDDGGPGYVSAGSVVTAAYHTALKNMIEGANNHYHDIDDRIY